MEYGCIGRKLPHSFSREIHALIENYRYELLELEPEELDGFMKKADFRAVNVTIPYKEAVIPYLAEISPNAAAIGAVNTIVNRGGRLFGYNTDFSGMDALVGKAGLSLEGRKVLILGTGGTSRTALALAKARGAREVLRVSRTKNRGAVSYEEARGLHGDAEIIINTTPCGMFPRHREKPLSLEPFTALEGVIDAIYNPLRTELVLDALERGVKAEGGLYMLAAQAVFAAERFLDKKYPETLVGSIYKKVRADKENIVLIGMSGAGKSSAAKALKRITERPAADTDAMIEQKAGMKIKDIFRKYGEEHFRRLESEAIEELAGRNGMVIATGGGAPLCRENLRALKKNGRIVLLERDLGEITPDPARPLADSEDKIRALYARRRPVYRAAADMTVQVAENPDATAMEILKKRFSE
ncbi:MAG: shikimate dehydrogenase [Abditibacteriota bacterium]|nr:shikimate dehydrogenase [Abditibacteriota bacterium]